MIKIGGFISLASHITEMTCTVYIHAECQPITRFFPVTFLVVLSDPFRGIRDLHMDDKKVTWKKLAVADTPYLRDDHSRNIRLNPILSIGLEPAIFLS